MLNHKHVKDEMKVVARVSKFILALVLAIAAMLTAAVVALVLTVNLIDWSRHKNLLISLVERYSDWEVRQLGDIEIDLYLPSEVRMRDVSLKQRAEDSSLAAVSAKHLEVNFAPLSVLFNDRIVIHHLHSSGARVLTREPPAEPPKDTGPLSIPHIKAGRIRDSELVFWVDGLEEDVNLHLTTFDIDSPGKGQDLTIAGKGELEGLPTSIEGTVGDLSRLAEDTVLPFNLKGAVGGDKLAVEGSVDSVEALTGRINLSMVGDGLPQLADRLGIGLKIPAYKLHMSVISKKEQVDFNQIDARLGESVLRGDASLKLGGAKPTLRAELRSPLLREQDLAGLLPEDSARVDDTAPPASSRKARRFDFLQALNAELSVKLADVQGERLGLLSDLDIEAALADGRLRVAGQVAVANETFSLEAQLGPGQEEAERTIIPFRLAVSMAGDTLSGEGAITAAAQNLLYRAQVAGEGNNLAKVAGSFGLALNEAPDYQLQLAVEGSTEQVKLENIRANLGESSLRGKVSVQLNEATPVVRAAFVSPLLREQDIASLIPAQETPGSDIDDRSGGTPTQAPSKSLTPLGFLDRVKGTVSYRVIDFQGERLGIEGGMVEGTIERGQLTLAGLVDAGNLQFTVNSVLGPQHERDGRPVLPFSAELAAAGDTLTAEGQISRMNGNLGLRAEAVAEGANLVRIAQTFDVTLTEVPPYRLQLTLHASPQQLRVEGLEATLGSSHVYGDMSLQLSGARPYVQADLGSSRLREQDLASLVPESSGTAGPKSSQVPQLEFLDAFNADLSLVAADLQGEQLGQISEGEITATLQEGQFSLAGDLAVRNLDITMAGELGPKQGSTDAAAPSTRLPFSLQLTAADDSLQSTGQITLQPGTFDIQLETSATGSNLERIARVFDLPMREPPAYALSFSASKTGNELAVSRMQFRLGESTVAGEAVVQLNEPRPSLEADVQIALLRQQDISAVIPPEEETADKHVFSREPFNLAALQELDAGLQLSLDRYVGPEGVELIKGMKVQGRLAEGVLNLQPLRVGLAGGELDGRVQLDSREAIAGLKVNLSAERVGLHQLVSPFFNLEEANMKARGVMGADLDIRGSGRSPHELVSSLDGEFSWAIYDGVVPAVIIEGLGLDLLEGAVSWFGETVTTGVNCGVGQFVITDGEIHTETFLLSTVDSLVIGDGRIDLGAESVDFKLETRAKDFSIFASDSPIEIKGQLNNISVDPVTGELLARTGAAALLGLINPALAVVPFTELGEEDGGECVALRKELERIRAESQ